MDVTRGEFELLKQIVADNQRRLENVDTHGTRGINVIQTQIADLIKDVAEMRADQKSASESRRAGRKWVATFVVATIASIGGIIGVLLEIASKVHGH